MASTTTAKTIATTTPNTPTTTAANNCKKIIFNINTSINVSQDFEIIFNKLNIIALNNNDSIDKTDYIYEKTTSGNDSFLYYDLSENTNIRITDNTNVIRIIGRSIQTNTTTGLLCKIAFYVPLDTVNTEYIINILYQMLVNYNTYSISGTSRRYTQSYNLTFTKLSEKNMYMANFNNFFNLLSKINFVNINFTNTDNKNYLLVRSTSNTYINDTKNLVKKITTLPYNVEYMNDTTLSKYTIKINNTPYTQPILTSPLSNALKSLYMYNP